MSLVPAPPLATYYLKKSIETLQRVQNPDARVYSLTIAGIIEIGNASWRQAMTYMQDCLEAGKSVGNKRQMTRSDAMLAASYRFQGEYSESKQYSDVLAGLAEPNNDPPGKIWASQGYAEIALRIRGSEGIPDALQHIERARQVLAAYPDQSQQLVIEGLTCLAHCHSGDQKATFEAVKQAMQVLRAYKGKLYYTYV